MKWQQQICMEFMSLMCSARAGPGEQYPYGALPPMCCAAFSKSALFLCAQDRKCFISCQTPENPPGEGPGLCGTSSLRRIECAF